MGRTFLYAFEMMKPGDFKPVVDIIQKLYYSSRKYFNADNSTVAVELSIPSGSPTGKDIIGYARLHDGIASVSVFRNRQ